ncbi:MAG: hypothetical protein AAF270_12885 [Pseudomonadota bacterium]
MRGIFLLIAWVTPALIAGALGWTGIWGTGSALGEFLIPIPVAGGVFHVPSFAVLAMIVLARQKLPGRVSNLLPFTAALLLAVALTLHVDFERLVNAIFTDYDPSGSILRFESNPVLLFVTCDAFFLLVWALMQQRSPLPTKLWLAVPVVPLVIVISKLVTYQVGGPVFERGVSTYGKVRGDEVFRVFTTATFDETAFRNWLAEMDLRRPWDHQNSEHLAVVFTNSQQVATRTIEETADPTKIIATACLYEEDRSTHLYQGAYDCFAERDTLVEALQKAGATAASGFGKDIDRWWASTRLCEQVDVSADKTNSIAKIDWCRSHYRRYEQDLLGFKRSYGQRSRAVRFVEGQARKHGVIANQPN